MVGLDRPFSISEIAFCSTPTSSASSAWLNSSFPRSSRTFLANTLIVGDLRAGNLSANPLDDMAERLARVGPRRLDGLRRIHGDPSGLLAEAAERADVLQALSCGVRRVVFDELIPEFPHGVHIELDFTKRHFPVFTPPGGKSPDDYLRDLCRAGLKERYGEHPSQSVLDRLEHELGVICRMGFASYFLIVMTKAPTFRRQAKSEVGSGAQSLRQRDCDEW